MYVYENKFSCSAEEMIKDYLDFRQERENRLNAEKNISSASTYNNNTDSFNLFHSKPFFLKDDYNYVKVYDKQDNEDKKWKPVFDKGQTPNDYLPANPITDMFMEDKVMSDKDMTYVKQVSSEISKKIQPIIENIVDEMEYEESPIYDDYIPKVIIDNVIDLVYKNAVAALPELNGQPFDIPSEQYQNGVTNINDVTDTTYAYVWSKEAITKELIRQLLFIEIFGRRRPYKRDLRDDYRYY